MTNKSVLREWVEELLISIQLKLIYFVDVDSQTPKKINSKEAKAQGAKEKEQGGTYTILSRREMVVS